MLQYWIKLKIFIKLSPVFCDSSLQMQDRNRVVIPCWNTAFGKASEDWCCYKNGNNAAQFVLRTPQNISSLKNEAVHWNLGKKSLGFFKHNLCISSLAQETAVSENTQYQKICPGQHLTVSLRTDSV